MKALQRVGIAIATATLLLSPLKTFSCGPFFDEAFFSYTLHPDLPLKFFADGKLGIVQPSFARSYLFSAYRTVSGKPLSASEQKSTMTLWDARMTHSGPWNGDSGEDSQNWITEHNKIPGVTKLQSLSTERAVSKSPDDTYNSYLNCGSDAFKTATTTLKNKVTKYGASSANVKDWLTNQDLVFCHCSGPNFDYDKKKYGPEPGFPAVVAATADATTKAERAYQIASARFYAQQFDEAAKDFDAIAHDESSEYKGVAPYLAARCMIRKGALAKTVDKAALQNATERLKAVIANERLPADIRDSATSLLSFVAIRYAPDATLVDLSKKLSAGDHKGNFLQDLADYTILLDRLLGSSDSDDEPVPVVISKVPSSAMTDMTEWILTMQSKEDASRKMASDRWLSHKSELWLMPAIVHAKASDKEAQALVDAALSVPNTSPAYYTVRYHAVRLLADLKNSGKALSAVNEALGNKNIPPSTNNLLLDQKATLAASLTDYWKDLVRIPAGEIADSGDEVPDELDKINAKNSYYVGTVAFDNNTVNVLNSDVPLNGLTTAPWTSWPVGLKRDYLQAIWTRATLLHDDKVVAQFTPLLAQQNPTVTKLLNEYKAATNPDQKKFLSAYILLTNPAMRPYLTGGTARIPKFNEIDDFQDNWWSPTTAESKQSSGTSEAKKKPAFINPTLLAQATAEDKRLNATGGGPTYLLTELIAYAQKPGPKDSRLPEALYHAIRSPKFGSTDKTTSALSKSAFTLLHKKYPGNTWTTKSKYYY